MKGVVHNFIRCRWNSWLICFYIQKGERQVVQLRGSHTNLPFSCASPPLRKTHEKLANTAPDLRSFFDVRCSLARMVPVMRSNNVKHNTCRNRLHIGVDEMESGQTSALKLVWDLKSRKNLKILPYFATFYLIFCSFKGRITKNADDFCNSSKNQKIFSLFRIFPFTSSLFTSLPISFS